MAQAEENTAKTKKAEMGKTNPLGKTKPLDKREPLDEREQKLLEAIREIGFGEIKVIINDGKPVRIEEVRKSIKL